MTFMYLIVSSMATVQLVVQSNFIIFMLILFDFREENILETRSVDDRIEAIKIVTVFAD